MIPEVRLLLLHKQKTSGRVRFLCLPSGVIAFEPLPAGASLRPEGYSPTVQVHPGPVVRAAEQQLGLPDGALEPDAEFQAWVVSPAGEQLVLLAMFTATDPPFEAVAGQGGRFIALTEARRLSPIELDLLRRAYEQVLG